ncbi:MAG: GGDEF domain-containing protein [Lachnospiraceae bacterium]|nr:GGDEF domain-containing protein [Lachnospiraceae bacterium]
MKDRVFHIGVMIGNVHTQHPMELIQGICEAAKTESVNITFFVGAQGNALDFWKGDENDLFAYNYQYNSLYDYSLIAGLDALIISYGTLCIYLDKDDREAFASKYRNVPLVILEEYDEDSCDSFIISDNYGSMYKIMEHLLSDHGYERILYLSGPKNNTDSNERERAYREAMKSHGIDVTENMVEYGDYSSEVDDLVERLLDCNPDAQAIVSANDEMALSIYRVCRKRGLIPGRDIAVTGYDDVDFAKRMDPPLTTANQDGLDMGYRALKCAVSLCNNPEPMKMKLPAKFLKRQSCGCKAQDVSGELELTDVLGRIESASDKEMINTAVSIAAAGSYQSMVAEKSRKNGKEYFKFLLTTLLKLSDKKSTIDNKDISESVLLQIQKFFGKDSNGNLDFSGFLSAFHQIMHYYMKKEKDPQLIAQLGLILGITDNYVTSYVMRSDEDKMMMLMNKSWAVPASIRYMIEKVEDENEFNSLALENVVTQGAKSAYLYLLPKPLKCDRDEQFKCPKKLELAAKYTNNKIRVYDKKDRPVVTKKEGFAAKFLATSKHNYVAFMLFAKEYQYGILLSEIDAASIGLMYGAALQISTAKAYMQISQRENEVKRQLYETLKELRNKNQVLSFVSSTDSLTGLFNRRGFIENAVTELNTHIGAKAAVFFSDLDHLKQINDKFGHKDGDFALENASAILRDTITAFRSEGTVCGRIGGDEFVSFIICENESDTEEIIKQLKENCRKFNENCDKPYYVEFSTGCVTFTCTENYSIAELTSQADACLYEAKKTRRQSVIKEDN